MTSANVGDILNGKVTFIADYGVFVTFGDGYTGLVHISEISDEFVDDISKYIKLGSIIKVKILEKDEKKLQYRLSFKKVCGNIINVRSEFIDETDSGFNALHQNLNLWVEEKISEINKKDIDN